MKYVGSKRKAAKFILPLILADRDCGLQVIVNSNVRANHDR